METYDAPAYAMAGASAAVAALRLMIKKGLVSREEAQAALIAEADLHQEASAEMSGTLNEQAGRILRFMAEKL